MECRSCGHALLPLHDFGSQPLANALLASREEARAEKRYPLALMLCPACSLVQLSQSVPPAELFSDYPYFSSTSVSFVEHARRLAERLVAERGLGERSLVVEVASNDGYLLQHYKAAGVPVLGVEPAANIAVVAERERGIPTEVAFFSRATAERLAARGVQADLIHAHNVLAHAPELPDFVAGLKRLLAPDGRIVIEVPYLVDLLDRVAFDTIYHEHVFYFSLRALDVLFRRAGLRIVDVERLAVHGGSLRVFVAHTGEPSAAVAALLEEEARRGLNGTEAYAPFSAAIARARAALEALLAERAASGRRLAAYGAAAKGAMLLNIFGLAVRPAYVVDKSPHKQNRFMPGVHVPIVSPEAFHRDPTDDVLLLAWNLADEIAQQEQAFLARGGRFILPLPMARVFPE